MQGYASRPQAYKKVQAFLFEIHKENEAMPIKHPISPAATDDQGGPAASDSLSSNSRRNFLTGLSVLPVGLGLGLLPVSASFAQSGVAANIKALTFDVFGTVVDWRGSIIKEGQ